LIRSLRPTAPPASSTLSLHDALPIFDLGQDVARQQHRASPVPFLPDLLLEHGFHQWVESGGRFVEDQQFHVRGERGHERHLLPVDRKSTRLNSSHVKISYAVFCLKKK